MRPSKSQVFVQLHCRTLTAASAKEEFEHHLSLYNITIATIQEYRQIHKPGDSTRYLQCRLTKTW